MDDIENTAPNSSIVAWVFVTVGMCLPSHCLATLGVTHIQQGDLTSLLLFFQNKASRLKMGSS
jgi:hypothetical protein